MNSYYAYTRVSTEKQGDGVSLAEQRAAIETHAEQRGLRISEWFEERQTAAKRGRPVFTEVVKLLEKGKANGLLIHKIDRSARHLGDWAKLSDLIDDGVDIQVVHDQLDLKTRGGRITADIQAVIAADYVRNLREEALKGIYGRYKQGLLPHAAPVGYLDQGGGKPKAIDPKNGPLVKKAFELYDSGEFSQRSLARKMDSLGLRNKWGNRLNVNNIAHLLKNRFYTGVVVYNRTGEEFPGRHEPLISKPLFSRVQDRMAGKTVKKICTHNFLYRQLVRCRECSRCMVGERQKGHVYYRCHKRGCPTTTIREEALERAIHESLDQVRLGSSHKRAILAEVEKLLAEDEECRVSNARTAAATLVQVESQIAKLTTAFVDEVIDKESYDLAKADLLARREELQGVQNDVGNPSLLEAIEDELELAETARLSCRSEDATVRRQTVKEACSNLTVSGREPAVELRRSFRILANSSCVESGPPTRGDSRTSKGQAQSLLKLLHSTAPGPQSRGAERL